MSPVLALHDRASPEDPGWAILRAMAGDFGRVQREERPGRPVAWLLDFWVGAHARARDHAVTSHGLALVLAVVALVAHEVKQWATGIAVWLGPAAALWGAVWWGWG